MSKKKMKKQPKKGADKKNEKLAIDGTFDDVLKISVLPSKKTKSK